VSAGLAALEAQGYRPIAPAERRDGHLAGSAEERARELESAFADPAVDAVMCVRGGYGSGQLLPLLDLERIAATGKPLIGMSDITHLLVPLAAAGGACLWGPMLLKHGRASEYTASSFNEAVSGRSYTVRAAGVPAQTIVPGRVRAPLTGGTTSVLCATLGTPWELDSDGRLLLLEDVGEEPYRIDRLLTQLSQAGKLAGAAGFVVAEHQDCAPERPERSQTLNQVLRRHLEPLAKPCLYGLPLGHGEHLASVPLGVRVELDASEGVLNV
jgi:muramoyltetrapeptide carboxypeptidase